MSNILSVTYEDALTVAKSDSVADPSGPFAGLLVTATGSVKLTTIRGGTVTLSTTTVGQILPIATSRVWSTGTSATVLGLVAPPFKPSTPSV